MLTAFGKWWLIIIISGCVAFLLAGIIFDLRWFIIMLMWIFILLPMAFAFFYIYHGSRYLNAINMVQHSVKLSPEQIEVEIIAESDVDKNTDQENKKAKFSDNRNFSGDTNFSGSHSVKNAPCVNKKLVLQYADILKKEIHHDGALLLFGKPNNGILWIPGFYKLDLLK